MTFGGKNAAVGCNSNLLIKLNFKKSIFLTMSDLLGTKTFKNKILTRSKAGGSQK
jgi:hypothetical protein